MNLRQTAETLFLNALADCKPSNLIQQKMSWNEGSFIIDRCRIEVPHPEAVYIIAFGKASLTMGKALMHKAEVAAEHVFCLTPETHPDETFTHAASHPSPDESSVGATQKLIHFIEQIPDDALVLAAISGGTSAMLCKPVEGIELNDLNAINNDLLKSGATIEEINAVRKHLSAVKGGQLLSYFKPNITLVDIVISDVPGDDLAVIGSGPTTPDASTFQDAYDTLLRYELWENAPASVRQHLEKGLTGEVRETLKPGEDPLQHHYQCIIGSAKIFAQSVAERAEQIGFEAWMPETAFNQPAAKVAERVGRNINEYENGEKSRALIFYGESTVKVTGDGKGGRNQELALRGALKIDGREEVAWLSAGTDGIDGPTDAAGAIVDGSTKQKAEARGLDAQRFIKRNDAYHFHEQMGTLLRTGATGNNVMDLVLILIDTEE